MKIFKKTLTEIRMTSEFKYRKKKFYWGENKILADILKMPVRKSWGMTFQTQALRTLDTTGALANSLGLLSQIS